VTVTFDL